MRNVIQLDGWKVVIPWGKMRYGDSCFIPTANPVHDKHAIRESAAAHGVGIQLKLAKENGVQGIRVWCVDPP